MVQEQGERSRLLTQMREMLSGGGGGYGSAPPGSKPASSEELARLKAEVLRRHEEAASAKAGWERAEAQAASWKGEARSLKERLVAVERVRERQGGTGFRCTDRSPLSGSIIISSPISHSFESPELVFFHVCDYLCPYQARADVMQSLQTRLEVADRRHANASQTMAARLEGLEARLAAIASLAAAGGSTSTADTQIRQLEEEVREEDI